MKSNNAKLKSINFFGKIIILLVFIFFGSWIFIRNLVPDGLFKIDYDFTHNSWIAGLRPIERVLEKQKIISDPIYLDLKLPTRFDSVVAKIDYDNQTKGDFRVGVFTNKEKWQILFGNFKNNEVTFDLRGMSLEKNNIPFVLSAPKATETNPVIIKRISFTATKAPLTRNELKKLLLKPKLLLLITGLLFLVSGFVFLAFFPITVSTFALLLLTITFLVSAALEFVRPGTMVNFFDSRIFMVLFAVCGWWHWKSRR